MNEHLLRPAAAPASASRERAARAKRRVRRARNFFLIALMAAFVSVGGHCLTGDETPVAATVDSGVERNR